ncbi:MAG: ABC transporter permease [Oscillospiraceae bacterium]|nr:ABC transporter permease [Oscillospiraceae bacterium]
MRNFSTVFITGFKYCWRNPVSVAVLIGFPILIIFVLGNALSSFISPDYDFEPIPVAAVVETDGNFGLFLQSEEISQFLEVNFTYKENALLLLNDNNVSLVVEEKDGEIAVTRPQVARHDTQIAVSIIDSYKQVSTAMEIAIMGAADLSELSELLKILESDITVTDSPIGGRVPSAIDYYAVTMLVMILLFTGMNGLELFKKSMFSETGERVLITPVSKPALIGGLLAASTVTSYLQGMVTFVFSGVVYGVYWGERIPLVLLTLFGITLFSQAFAIFLTILLNNINAAMGAMQVSIFTMTFVAGGYTKINFGAAEKIFQYSPNSLAHTVIFGAVYGGNESKMTSDLLLLFAYGTVLFIVAFLLGRRRLA